ncbi:MAG: DUF4097 family beta strand repeat protein [Clostridia bacterium]|nr:DUF4097 family beta strand repeat protein [Clostridia bacterium]
MGKKTKIWLLAAAALVLLGGILFTVVMTVLGWDLAKLSAARYETNTTEITGNIFNISINADTADIALVYSEDGECKVECYERADEPHSVEVIDGALTVVRSEKKSFLNYIGFNFGSPKITVYLPHTDYDLLQIEASTGDIEVAKEFRLLDADISLSTGDVRFYAFVYNTLKIGGSTGDIYVEDISAGRLDLSVSTGKVTAKNVDCGGDVTVGVSTGKAYLTDIACKNLNTSGDTGDLSLSNVIATEKFSIERSTGDVKLEGCDAAELSVQTDTGDVTGSLLTSKVFITETDTGRVEVPKTVTGGKCEITTDTGDIKIEIK